MGNMSSQYESLTRDQKVLITRGWEIIRMDTLKFGTSVMYHLLAAHPKLDDFFHFENDEAKIRYHAKNFVREMDKWVRAIDSPQELDELLYTIATTHLPRKVGKDEYNKLRKSAMRQLKVQMGEEVFDKKMERVWDTCLSMVIAYLIDTMNVLKHEKRKKCVKCVTNMGNVSAQYETLTREDKVLVVREWEAIRSDTMRFGVELFTRLVTSHPRVEQHFHFNKNPGKLENHAMNFMRAIDSLVRSINEPTQLDGILYALAKAHLPRKISKEHYNGLRKCALKQLKAQLGAEVFDKRTEKVWDRCLAMVFAYLSDSMILSTEENTK